MNIGMIVYSETGHTLSVAVKLQQRLAAAGHQVALERLETVAPLTMGATTARLKSRPPIEPYDALVLGTPVRGGAPSPPMAAYLAQTPSLHGKRVALLVTGFFPYTWGRQQTLARLKETCEAKGATVCGAGSVRWPSLTRRRQIAAAVDSLVRALEG